MIFVHKVQHTRKRNYNTCRYTRLVILVRLVLDNFWFNKNDKTPV